MISKAYITLPSNNYRSLLKNQPRNNENSLKGPFYSTKKGDEEGNDKLNLVKDGGVEYYKGLISSNDPKDSERDNITPNLRLAGIFVVILAVLGGGFIYINKDIPPPPF